MESLDRESDIGGWIDIKYREKEKARQRGNRGMDRNIHRSRESEIQEYMNMKCRQRMIDRRYRERKRDIGLDRYEIQRERA